MYKRQDRGIDEYNRLLSVINGANVYRRLCETFRKADEKYNSGLFHFAKEKDRDPPDELTLILEIDDKPLKDIIGSLYYPDCPYEFSVLSADILGQVYEQFLGKVIRLTDGHRAVVEEKPEVKKAGGVYYTPTYIVDYIVKNTVGKFLNPDSKIEELRKSQSKIVPNDISSIRILDPACGSGSFLIGAYQYLLDWHRNWYAENNPEKWAKAKSPVLYQAHGGEWKLTTVERRRILLNNIYGVDIDPQSVEVTKLSLLLKVLEGESEQSLSKQLRMFHERALPDLDSNIKCGNSLIGPDFYQVKQMRMFDDEECLRINVFDWEKEFPDIMKAGGFDVVIGNPPYVRQELLGNLKEYFQKHYKVYHGVADLYAYFIERGITLLREGGIFSYIVANKWMRANYGEPLRRWLKQQCIEQIIDFGDLPVFQQATTYPCILVVSKTGIIPLSPPLAKGVRGIIKLNPHMAHIPCSQELKNSARELRKNMTPAEKMLWYELLSKDNLEDLRFLRQKPIEDFIVDFYCSKLLLVIEIDGDSHFSDEAKGYDTNRTNVLEKYGIKVLRYTNREVINNFEGMAEDLQKQIWLRIEELTGETTKSPHPPLTKGAKESGLPLSTGKKEIKQIPFPKGFQQMPLQCQPPFSKGVRGLNQAQGMKGDFSSPNRAGNFSIIQVKTLAFDSLESYVQNNHYTISHESLDDGGWSLSDDNTQKLLDKLKAQGIPLGEYVQGKIYRGVLTGLNEAFVIDEETKKRLIAEDKKSTELIKPFLAGKDIKRYQEPTSDKYLIFTRRGIKIKEYSAIEKYLQQFKDRLMSKPKDWKGGNWKGRKPGVYKWYEIQDAIDYYGGFEKDKILWPEIANGARFAFDSNDYYANNKVFMIPEGSKYLVGLLNSSTLKLFIHSVCTDLQGDSFNFSGVFLAKTPIRNINFSDARDKARHDKMVDLVDQMLSLNKLLAAAKTAHEKTSLQRQIDATDRQIDNLVYELYGLTEEEIKIVEGKAS